MSQNPKKRDFSSLLPKKGWPKRNYHYLSQRVLPGLLSKPRPSPRNQILPLPECGRVRLTWTGHAGFLVQFGQVAAMIDPNFAAWHGPIKRQRQPGINLADLPELDIVMVSHAHYDHLHKRALKRIRTREGIIVPSGSGSLVKKLGFNQVTEMRTWEELELPELQIIHTPSAHWGARFIHDTHRHYGGYLLSSAGKTVFHCGDSAYFDGFKEIGKRASIDVALMPIGAYGAPSGRNVHLNPEEALQAFAELGAKTFVPMHYGSFPLGTEPMDEPLERLLTEADRLGILSQVTILDEGHHALF